MQIICILLQTDNHASISPLSFLQARCPSCHPTNSIKAMKASLTHCYSAIVTANLVILYWLQPSFLLNLHHCCLSSSQFAQHTLPYFLTLHFSVSWRFPSGFWFRDFKLFWNVCKLSNTVWNKQCTNATKVVSKTQHNNSHPPGLLCWAVRSSSKSYTHICHGTQHTQYHVVQ